MVDETEKAGHRPHLANPTEAKKRMGSINKTDALDAKGLAILLHSGASVRASEAEARKMSTSGPDGKPEKEPP